MKLLTVEPTPSPHSMKLTVDDKLPLGVRYTWTRSEVESIDSSFVHDSAIYAALLRIDGVRSLFRTADFIALDRFPSADWQRILEQARDVLGAPAQQATDDVSSGRSSFGEVHVFVQLYRGIPMQVRVRTASDELSPMVQEARAALPPRFADAVAEAAAASMIRERHLEPLGIRYGEPADVLSEVVAELDAAYSEQRLASIVATAKDLVHSVSTQQHDNAVTPAHSPNTEELEVALQALDWRTRFAALSRIIHAQREHLTLYAKALEDEQTSIRRLAVVLLGDLRHPDAMPYVQQALRDPSPAVRRTAGDVLSDWADPSGIPAMIDVLLHDANKLVRWRAARYLYEVGDESALEALRNAMVDEHFEIQLQASMAVERIERGEQAAGSIWQQMMNRPRT